MAGLDVVQRLREKDESALRELMERYGDMLMRTAYLLLKERQAAEEAVQDAFLQAYRKIGQLKEADKLQSWLIRIVVNRCRMKQRPRSWRMLVPFAQMRELPLEDAGQPGPEEHLLISLRNERLSEAVHRLDYKYREVITLYYFNEWSVAEIAWQLRENENTVKARLARGRRRLKDMLLKEGEQNGIGAERH